jgi:hypothetical protein
VRAASELPLEQTTLDEKNAASSAQAGSIVRATNASAIPRSDAPTSVAASGHDVRFCGEGDGRTVAAVADVWFRLDTGQDPGWRMMCSRPVIAA